MQASRVSPDRPRQWLPDDGCVFFEIVGEISNVETIAVGRGIRRLSRLRKLYGPGMKPTAWAGAA